VTATLKATVENLLAQLPGPASPAWPGGERFVTAFAHGSMRLELYAPRGHDPQQPHAQDELYFVVRGEGTFVLAGERQRFGPGDAFFVPAGADHRFEGFGDDFVTWVVFWGPEGGEPPVA
jgi:mannose-6-phosphate isomerase-like protein (cupin superfamily)